MLLDTNGRVLYAGDLVDGTNLGDLSLHHADLRGLTLHALDLSGADLRAADFRGCDLYWLNLFSADCRECLFDGAILEGADLKSACFRDASFIGARITADRLGSPSSLAHADLRGANLSSVILAGTEYDAKTLFPPDFFPSENGLVMVPITDDWLMESDGKCSE